jgi:hypothetical protein
MNAVWLKNLGLSYREDVPIPIPGIDEALIKVHLAGICSTDLELLRGYYPYEGILGHEFVGEVIDLQSDDPASRSWIGKRVVGEINITCGKCKTFGPVLRCFMRFLLKAEFPVEVGNAAGKNGSLGKTIRSILDDLKPEATYFLASNGKGRKRGHHH